VREGIGVEENLEERDIGYSTKRKREKRMSEVGAGGSL
jgi:hypothetical protein